jgi:hypothetical protein
MRRGSLLGIGVLALFGGCQACSDCTDYSAPVRDTAPGEMYAGRMLPAGQPVMPQVLQPGTSLGEPVPALAPAPPGFEYPGANAMP